MSPGLYLGWSSQVQQLIELHGSRHTYRLRNAPDEVAVGPMVMTEERIARRVAHRFAAHRVNAACNQRQAHRFRPVQRERQVGRRGVGTVRVALDAYATFRMRAQKLGQTVEDPAGAGFKLRPACIKVIIGEHEHDALRRRLRVQPCKLRLQLPHRVDCRSAAFIRGIRVTCRAVS